MSKQAVGSEIDAMKMVDQALGALDDAARRRVMDWASSKYELPAVVTSAAKGTAASLGSAATKPTRDIKAFLAHKKPASFYERVACLAYFLEKVEGKSDLKTYEITKANTQARQSKMSNPALFVKHATHTYGYLTSLGHGKVGISSRGEAVVEALPDRERVKQALADHPTPKRGKKKSTSKK